MQRKPCRTMNWLLLWPILLSGACVAAQSIDTKLQQLRDNVTVSFGTAPTDDFAALPQDVLGLVSWNIQIGGTSTNSTAERPPQVEKALGEIFDGTYQLLAAQEISSSAGSTKLLDLLPGPATDWNASFTDTTTTMDNGFWFRSSASVVADDVILHTATRDSKNRIVTDKTVANFPPRIGHFKVGSFDFTLITIHLTFASGDTEESKRELENILDFLDAYFYTAGHDPDVIIAGDFNTPSALSGQTGKNNITIDSILDQDFRFQSGERRFAVTVHEPTSRNSTGAAVNNYDHFILSADCLEEFVTARRLDTTIL